MILIKIKRNLTLIEVVLSMGLVAILLTSLISLTTYMWRSQTKVREIRKEVLAKELLWTRLEDSLSRLLTISSNIQKKESDKGREIPVSLISDGKEVSFSYRPLVGGSYEFNTIRQGRIYVEEGRLFFESMPSPLLCEETSAESLRESQVWLEGVDQLQFFFLHMPILKASSSLVKNDLVASSKPQEGWNQVWLKDWDVIPHAIIVELTVGGKIERWPIWLQVPLAHYLPRESFGDEE